MPPRWFVLASTLMWTTVAAAAPALEIPAGRPSAPVDRRVARNLLDRLPLAFEMNRGQAPAGWDFLVRCRGYHAFVKSTGVTFSLDGVALAMSLDGADRREPSTNGLELPGKANYFIGNDSSKWLSNVPLVRGARYADVAPGTTWSVGGDGRALEFAFDVEAGTDAPRLKFDGGAPRVADDGSLRVAMPSGEARISAPVAWQETASGRVVAGARFVVEKDGAVRVAVAPRDPELAVHVDPTVTYATYLGGSAGDQCLGAAMDAAGAAYVSGVTDSSDFPTTTGAYSRSRSGGGDAFVAKISASGSSLAYSTYIGSTATGDILGTLLVDASGNAYAAGTAFKGDYPTTAGVYLPTAPGSGAVGVLTELNSTGSGLVFSSFLQTGPRSIAFGPSGGVYAADSAGFALYSAGATSLAFYKRLSPTQYPSDAAFSVEAVGSDTLGYAYVTGMQNYNFVPATSGAYQTSMAGDRDVFVSKCDSSGAVVYTTYIGGSSGDNAAAIDVNLAGQAYVVGLTVSANFPTTADAYRTTIASSGNDEGFVTRFNAAGTALRYSTYLGVGPGSAACIRVHPGSSFVVGGQTGNSALLVSNGFQGTYGGSQDGFALKFNRDNTLAWSSFCGGSSTDSVNALGMASDGSVSIGGITVSTDFPTASPYQSSAHGGYEPFVLKVPDTLPIVTAVVVNTTSLPTWTVGYAYDPVQLSGSGGVGPYSWTVGSGALPPGVTLGATGIVSGTPTQTGTFTFKVHIDDPSEMFADRQMTLTVNPTPTISPPTMPDATIGTAYDRVAPVSGGSGSMAFAVISGSTPPGTNLSGSGHLTGTPTQTGNYSFNVQVTDGRGATGSGSVSMNVNVRPTIEGASPPAQWTEARPFAFQFQSFGGSGAKTWSVPIGTAPTLTAINAATGRLAGVTRSFGVYPFTVRATDTAGATVDAAFTVTLNAAPQITTSTLPTVAVGRPYSVSLQLSGGTPPFDWFADGGAMPPGLSIGGTTGLLGGVATGPATGFVAFTCDDVTGATASRGFALRSADAVDLTKKKSTQKLDIKAAATVLRYLELTQGALLGVQVKGGSVGKTSPELHLVDSAGAEFDLGQWTRTTSKSVTVKRAPIPATGRYFLTVQPAAGFNGKLTLTVSVAPATTFASQATIASMTTAEYRFSAPPDAKLSITAKAPKGSAALPHVESVFAPDGSDLVPGGKSTEKGASATFTSKVPLAGGDYRVVISLRDLSAGEVAWTVRLKAPKKYLFSMPDVPAGE